jgi:prepilin-type N-terminal cleavage/methylation domain-containing protein
MKTRNSGFTLLELMVVLVIAGILVGVGIPAMGNFIRNARMTSAANDVMAALHYARSEAIKRRAPVTVCTSTDPLAAAPSCANTPDLRGWIVFVDNDADGQWDSAATFVDVDGDGNQDVLEEDGPDADSVWTALQPDEDIDGDGNQDVEEPDVPEVILTQHDLLPGTISGRGSANPLRITYLDTGFAQDANQGEIVLCDERGNVASSGELSAARGITIAATGRAGVTRDPGQIAGLIADIGGTIGGCSG